ALGGVLLAFALARSPLLAPALGACATAAGSVRLQAGVLLVGGSALLGGQLYRFEHPDTDDLEERVSRVSEVVDPTDLTEAALTDAGRTIALCVARKPSGQPLDEAEADVVEEKNLSRRVIQTGPAELICNCHGWVFTAGRHWLRHTVVERILQDNGYY